ncbi:hypothetical protein [Halomarina oriensis]|uniref:Uncharacterized protein n=1 Tax=Halomarina oriensis TaxID=671145 RepID=A0A6B0GLX9_9EURY|nr:hypothetical protein [Halomarina oriensis]MWG34901.1 hypothetical protein [Halomarina oriensis]
MTRESPDGVQSHERRTGPLRDAVYNTVRAWDGVETGTTNGYPAFLVEGRPFAVVGDGGVALGGLSAADRERLRGRWSALTVDWPTTDTTGDGRVRADGGRPGGGAANGGHTDGGRSDPWPLVPIGGNDLVVLRRFVRLSYDGVRSGRAAVE